MAQQETGSPSTNEITEVHEGTEHRSSSEDDQSNKRRKINNCPVDGGSVKSESTRKPMSALAAEFIPAAKDNEQETETQETESETDSESETEPNSNESSTNLINSTNNVSQSPSSYTACTARLVMIRKDRESLPSETAPCFMLKEEGTTIGRGSSDDYTISPVYSELSRKHVKIWRDKLTGEWHVSDSNSKNGTFINGFKVIKSEIHNGDILTLGGGANLNVGERSDVLTSDLVFCFEVINDNDDNNARVIGSAPPPSLTDRPTSTGSGPPHAPVASSVTQNRVLQQKPLTNQNNQSKSNGKKKSRKRKTSSTSSSTHTLHTVFNHS